MEITVWSTFVGIAANSDARFWKLVFQKTQLRVYLALFPTHTRLLLLLRVLNRERLVGVAQEMLAILRAGLSRIPTDVQAQSETNKQTHYY